MKSHFIYCIIVLAICCQRLLADDAVNEDLFIPSELKFEQNSVIPIGFPKPNGKVLINEVHKLYKGELKNYYTLNFTFNNTTAIYFSLSNDSRHISAIHIKLTGKFEFDKILQKLQSLYGVFELVKERHQKGKMKVLSEEFDYYIWNKKGCTLKAVDSFDDTNRHDYSIVISCQ